MAVMGALLLALPNRFRLLPVGVDGVLMGFGLLPMLVVQLSGAHSRTLIWERSVMGIFLLTLMFLGAVNLIQLITTLLEGGDHITALQLLASGVALWGTNVIVFGLSYWHSDRGGPERRQRVINAADREQSLEGASFIKADWHFPQQDLPETGGYSWRPAFLDYLFLAYCNATAFSPTGAVPLTPRAMVLMMVESGISLITMAVIAARAINILDA